MNIKQRNRTIIFYKNYFEDFFINQSNKVKNKIIWTFDLIEELPRVPEMYLKHIENAGDLYEIRNLCGRVQLNLSESRIKNILSLTAHYNRLNPRFRFYRKNFLTGCFAGSE